MLVDYVEVGCFITLGVLITLSLMTLFFLKVVLIITERHFDRSSVRRSGRLNA